MKEAILLKKHLWAMLMLLIIACLFQACVSQTPVPQYSESIRFAVAYVHDDRISNASDAVPDDISNELTHALTERNLSVSAIGFSSVKDDLTAIRDTERRIPALASHAQGAQYLLLVETSTEFYSPLSGRYRWDVNTRVTIVDLSSKVMISDKFTLPAVLMYAHEDGDDAIGAVSADIEKRIASLVDRFLAGQRQNAKAQAPSASLSGALAPPEAEAPAAGASPEKRPEAIYFVLIDRFFNAGNQGKSHVAPGDPEGWHGGDLRGVARHLGYLHDMGFTQIWLSPIFEAAHEKFFSHGAFHGYWTYDLNAIDPYFGTEEDLRELSKRAQGYGMGIVLDFVVNHVGYGSPLVESKPEWFHPAETIGDWNDENQLVNRQVHGLPDLNQGHPEVREYIEHAAQKWLSFPNIIGLRLDAVKHVSIDFWHQFNTFLKKRHPGVMLLGEYFDGDPKKVDDVQKRGGFTHLFDFPFAFAVRDIFCEKKSLAHLASVVSNDQFYSHPNQMVTFIDNHDMPRFYSFCGNRRKAMELGLKTLLAWRGIPSIYYGTEVPLSGNREPDNRADMSFTDLKYQKVIKAGLEQRRAYPVLARGSTSVYEYTPTLAVFGRDYGNQHALVILSRPNRQNALELPAGEWRDIETQAVYSGRVEDGWIRAEGLTVLVQDGASIPLSDRKMRRVTFRFPEDLHEYMIAGSVSQLGQWDPDKAPKTEGREISIEVPSQTVILYKPVRIEGGKKKWAQGDNRELFVKDGDLAVDVAF